MHTSSIELKALVPQYWDEVKKIYEEGIETGHATFETNAPDWDSWDKAHISSCRIIALVNNEVAGWAALLPVSGRGVYSGVAEVSIYVASKFRGKGIGKQLLMELISQSEAHQFWTLQAGVFPENEASVKLHEHLGFRIVGRREKIGQLHGHWRDTLLLERRSVMF